jgi:hypothetical protein
MSNPEDLSPTDSASVSNLADDYRRRQEAWRAQATDLARMRAEVLNAAEKEAASIVTTARADIRSIIVNARRELLGLAKQIEALPTPQEESTGDLRLDGDSVRAVYRLVDARHMLTDILQEAQPELERMREEAAVVAPRPQAATTPELDPHLIEYLIDDNGNLTPAPATSEDVAEHAAEIQISEPPRPRTLTRVLLIVAVVLGLIALAATFWTGRVGVGVGSGPVPPVTPRAAAPVAPPPAPPPSPEAIEQSRPELTAAAERWLDAYYQRDSKRMTAVARGDFKLSDQRASGEKPGTGLRNLRRSLEQMNVEFIDESAILTAKMIEKADASDTPRQYVSWISQLWLRDSGQWRLTEVRIISDAKLR